MKRLMSDFGGFFLLGVLLLILAAGTIVDPTLNRGQGYHAAIERLWERITNPRKSNQCENALRQISLAIPSGVQTGKETK